MTRGTAGRWDMARAAGFGMAATGMAGRAIVSGRGNSSGPVRMPGAATWDVWIVGRMAVNAAVIASGTVAVIVAILVSTAAAVGRVDLGAASSSAVVACRVVRKGSMAAEAAEVRAGRAARPAGRQAELLAEVRGQAVAAAGVKAADATCLAKRLLQVS